MIVVSIHISGTKSLMSCPVQLLTHDWKPVSLADVTPLCVAYRKSPLSMNPGLLPPIVPHVGSSVNKFVPP